MKWDRQDLVFVRRGFSIHVDPFPGSPVNNAIHCGNGFHSEKSPDPLWGETISPNNGLDLLNTVKLIAVKQPHYSSKRKGG